MGKLATVRGCATERSGGGGVRARKLWVKARFYFWRTVIDQVVWARFHGSWLHERAMRGFAKTLHEAIEIGWLLAPRAGGK